MTNSVSSQDIRLFIADIEVDGKLEIDKGVYPNITEIALKNLETNKYFVEYFEKSEYALGDDPYKKSLPPGKVRRSFSDGMQRVFSFINQNAGPKTINILSGYNWWKHDKKVIDFACRRFGVEWPKQLNHSFCYAYLAGSMGFKNGTSQRDLAKHYRIKHITSHRAFNDVRVLSRIVNKMWEKADLKAIKKAMLLPWNQHPVRAVRDCITGGKFISKPRVTPMSIDTNDVVKRVERVYVGVIFDLETTGLEVDRDRITEFGAKILSPHGINATYQQLVNPKKKIPSEVRKLTGITNKMVAKAPTFDKVWKKVNHWIQNNDATKALRKGKENLDVSVVWIGYYISGFDIPLLQNEIERWTREDYRKGLNVNYFAWDLYYFMNTYYNKEYPGPKPVNKKLQVIRDFYGIPEDHAHRALGDVNVTEKVMKLHFGKANMMKVITENLVNRGRYINSKIMILKANGGYPTLKHSSNSKKRERNESNVTDYQGPKRRKANV